MKFLTTLNRDEDGVWIAECPSIPGCVSQGETQEEAMANIQEAIAGCLEVRAERGLALTIEPISLDRTPHRARTPLTLPSSSLTHK